MADDGTVMPVLHSTRIIDPFGLDNFLYFANYQNLKNDAFGAFVHVDYGISDRLTLTGGLRYSHETKDARNSSDFSVAPDTLFQRPYFDQYGMHGRPLQIADFSRSNSELEESWGSTTGEVGIKYNVNDSALIYGSISTGFLSGGINNNGTTFDEQKSLAYEVGLKSQWRDDSVQFNLAAFRNEYTDLTTSVIFPLPDGTFTAGSVNSGEIFANGLEAELVWLPAAAMYLSISVSMLDSKFGLFNVLNRYQLTNGVPASSVNLGFLAREGEQAIYAPDMTISAFASYDIDLGESGTLTPMVQFYQSDDYWAGALPYPQARQEAYSSTDFRLVWFSGTDRWSIEAFIENIENAAVLGISTVSDNDNVQANYGHPRNYGLKVRFRL